MPITQDRMLRLISAAETFMQKIVAIADEAELKRLGIEDYLKEITRLSGETNSDSPLGRAVYGLLRTYDELISSIKTPVDIQVYKTILTERAHFNTRASSNRAARAYQRRRRGSVEPIDLTTGRGTFDYDAPTRNSQTLLHIKEPESESDRYARIAKANELRNNLFEKAIDAGLTPNHPLAPDWEAMVEILDQQLFNHPTDATIDETLKSAQAKGLTPDHPLAASFNEIKAAIKSQIAAPSGTTDG